MVPCVLTKPDPVYPPHTLALSVTVYSTPCRTKVAGFLTPLSGGVPGDDGRDINKQYERLSVGVVGLEILVIGVVGYWVGRGEIVHEHAHIIRVHLK